MKAPSRTLLPALAALLLALPAPAAPPAHPAPAARAAAAAVDHGAFDRLLRKHVNDKGLVNYKGFKADQKEFNQYLDLLSKNPPASS